MSGVHHGVYSRKYCVENCFAKWVLADDVTRIGSERKRNKRKFVVLMWMVCGSRILCPKPLAMNHRHASRAYFSYGELEKLITSRFWKTVFHLRRLKALAKENILAMVCDSTNALKAVYLPIRKCCYRGLIANHQTRKKIVLWWDCFKQYVGRLVGLGRVAKNGRYPSRLNWSIANEHGPRQPPE